MTAPKPKIGKECARCGATFEVHEYRAKTARFCSKACWSERAPLARCDGCGVPFKVIVGTRERFCSNACRHRIMRGDQASRWEGGKSLYRDRAQASGALVDWRIAVFKRDGWRCQACGVDDQPIHAHHVKAWATHPEVRLDVDNGLTLCIDCHGRVHGKNFRRREARHCTSCNTPITRRSASGKCRRCVRLSRPAGPLSPQK